MEAPRNSCRFNVNENLQKVRAGIAEACQKAGRNEADVRLVAVSKRQPMERLVAAYEAGHRDFGENFVQELERKKSAIGEDARWHMIGHLQRNKAKRAIHAAMIHTVDTVKLARAISNAAKEQISVRALIEVNIAGESTKAGVAPEDCEKLLSETRDLSSVELCGLMCLPPRGEGRRWFAELRSLRDRLAASTGISLTELSMGMSGDYAEAIAEGSTIVRIGTAIFGERPPLESHK